MTWMRGDSNLSYTISDIIGGSFWQAFGRSGGWEGKGPVLPHIQALCRQYNCSQLSDTWYEGTEEQYAEMLILASQAIQ